MGRLIEDFIYKLRTNGSYNNQIVHKQVLSSQTCKFGELEKSLPEKINDFLINNNIQLFSHQVSAINKIRKNQNVVIVTPTASGKTLAFNIPIFEAILNNKMSSALYLYPTKALTNDQLKVIRDFEKHTGIDGKSNVFDALCFVLGRMSSKGLRADKLGNLVFNGGKTTKPSKEAEVDIYLSNEQRELLDVELDEIKISRIVKKSGSSTYYLNNNKATRTEIVEVLKRASIDPDGYNIILQGDKEKL